jgi:hypothetical protein
MPPFFCSLAISRSKLAFIAKNERKIASEQEKIA